MAIERPIVKRSAHSIVDLPLAVRFASWMPILIVDPGEVPVFVTSFLRNMLLLGSKGPTVAKAAKAIGLLYDFYTLEKHSLALDERGVQLLIKQFYEARRYGCEGLGWRPVSLKTALDDLEHVSQFSMFCQDNYGHIDANPSEQMLVSSMSNKEFNNWLVQGRIRKRFDLLYHAFGTTQEAQGVVTRRAFRPDTGKSGRVKSAKYFPPDRVLEFISKAGNVRDTLCWLLMFYGGLRISELMHLYVRDISLDKRTGMARVVLADPREGKIQWTTKNGTQRNGIRADFLHERYARVPRQDNGDKHPERAGWKGMKFEDEQNRDSLIYWSDPRIGQLFWKLHVEYMRSVRLRVPDKHPYYFVTMKDDAFGAPLKLKNLREQFYDTAKRIGLSQKQDGVNPHGARHFYGYFGATWLRFSKERLQVMMHHRSILSTEVYYAIDVKVVRDELALAHKRMLDAVRHPNDGAAVTVSRLP
jgi:integrase